MKKEEFVALGVSEELAAKAETASLKELEGYVAKAEYDTVTRAKDQMEKDIKERDDQLDTLKKSSGDNEELTKRIDTLQKENKAAKEKYDTEMKELKISTAVKLAITGTAHDVDIVAGLVDKEKLVLTDGGTVAGLDEQIKALKESKSFLFKAGEDDKKDEQHKGSGYVPKAGGTITDDIGKSIAEDLNKAATGGDNPYAKAWG